MRAQGTPLVDANNSAVCDVTFVWKGKTPPELTGDFTHWAADSTNPQAAPLALERVEPNVWAKTLKFPRDAYLEYIYLKNGKRVNDPFNAHVQGIKTQQVRRKIPRVVRLPQLARLAQFVARRTPVDV